MWLCLKNKNYENIAFFNVTHTYRYTIQDVIGIRINFIKLYKEKFERWKGKNNFSFFIYFHIFFPFGWTRGFCDIFEILRIARYSIVGMKKIVNKGSKKDRKGEKKGTEGCAVPSRICNSRYSARCLCAEEPVSPSSKERRPMPAGM